MAAQAIKPALTAPTRAATARPDNAPARGAPFASCRVDTGGDPRDAAPGCGPADEKGMNPSLAPVVRAAAVPADGSAGGTTCSIVRTLSASRLRCASSGGESASSQCTPLMK